MARDTKKAALDGFDILLACCLSALGLYVFVYPANFAPSGVDGIATMIQSALKINAGLTSLLINIPILIVAWFRLNRKYVAYTLIFTVLHSGLLIFLSFIRFYQYVSPVNKWIPVVFSGVLLGARTGIMIRIGGSSGGIDIIGSLFQKKRPYINIEVPISVTCYCIIGLSFFVYNRNPECVLLSIVQMFVFSRATGAILHSSRTAVEVKIITSRVQELSADIIGILKHGGTLLNCKGIYTDQERNLIFCVINVNQMRELVKVVKKYPDTFAYFQSVGGVWGNFRRDKSETPH